MIRVHAASVSAPNAQGANTFGLWNLGFRPFYLLASLFAAISVPLWVAQYAGLLDLHYVHGAAWHASEMLLGYTLAVIAGFLFTAVRNWTGHATPTGLPLAGIAGVWLAGRVLAATRFDIASACADVAFPLAVAVGIAVPLWRARKWRNAFFVGLLVAVAAAALVLHLSGLDVVAWPERAALRTMLDLMLFVMAVMAGRVIPMFTNNAIPGTNARRQPVVEVVALAGILVLAVFDAWDAPAAMVSGWCAVLALVHGARLVLWRPWRTARTPLVWILHAAYAWIVVHLLLRSLAAAGAVPDALATHALTIGAIGALTLGMMTRTARGHTGRPLVADRRDVAIYIFILVAALARVAGPLAWPAAYVATVIVAGACWSGAFALYVVAYAPSLVRARVDGRPG